MLTTILPLNELSRKHLTNSTVNKASTFHASSDLYWSEGNNTFPCKNTTLRLWIQSQRIKTEKPAKLVVCNTIQLSGNLLAYIASQQISLMVSLCPTLNHLYFQSSYILLSLLSHFHLEIHIPYIFLLHLMRYCNLFSSWIWFPTVSTDDLTQDLQIT